MARSKKAIPKRKRDRGKAGRKSMRPGSLTIGEKLGVVWKFHKPFILAFFAVKVVQFILYPDPYMWSDTGEFINSAITLKCNPYKPIGYSLFIAFSKILLFPVGLLFFQSLYRFLATLWLGIVLEKHYRFHRWLVLGTCLFIGLDPLAILHDHFILSDSLFVTLTIASIATFLAYIRKANWLFLIVVVLFVEMALAVRFVGLVYPPLFTILIVIRYGFKRWFHCIVIIAATVLTILILMTKMDRDLGIYKVTTFDGWTMIGNIAPVLNLSPEYIGDIDDPETRLLYEYMASFPAETYEDPNPDYYRWHRNSPAKQLLNIFCPIYPDPDSSASIRNRWFLHEFMSIAKKASTPAQRTFQKYRIFNQPQLADHMMNYHHAYILVNELLGKVNSQYMKTNRLEYLTDYFFPNLIRVFFPNQLIVFGKGWYTYRGKPDDCIRRFWFNEDSSKWKPRFGDYFAVFRWSYAYIITIEWLSAIGIWCYGLYRSRKLKIPFKCFILGLGTVLGAFAVSYGFAVAYTATVFPRYMLPIMPFVILSAAMTISELGSDKAKKKSTV